ncbi:hypothetical protein GGR56DRAFT_476527 [Xylariaceae sp. FL0804]|nr:hypothetical protein GGR56DRAFT_476527 [Xylariaceae sp. FL0804]
MSATVRERKPRARLVRLWLALGRRRTRAAAVLGGAVRPLAAPAARRRPLWQHVNSTSSAAASPTSTATCWARANAPSARSTTRTSASRRAGSGVSTPWRAFCATPEVLYSVDYPFSANEKGLEWLRELEASGLVTPEQLERIAYRNAGDLLGLRATAMTFG